MIDAHLDDWTLCVRASRLSVARRSISRQVFCGEDPSWLERKVQTPRQASVIKTANKYQTNHVTVALLILKFLYCFCETVFKNMQMLTNTTEQRRNLPMNMPTIVGAFSKTANATNYAGLIYSQPCWKRLLKLSA